MEYKNQIKIQNKNLETLEIINDLHLKCKTIIKQKNYDADNVVVNIPTMIGMTMSLIEKYKNKVSKVIIEKEAELVLKKS